MSEPHKLPKPVKASVDHVSWMTGRIQGKNIYYCESNIISKIWFEVRKKIHPCVFPVNLCGKNTWPPVLFATQQSSVMERQQRQKTRTHRGRWSMGLSGVSETNLYGPFWLLMVACSSAEFSGCLGKQPFLYTLICVFSDFTVCCLVRKCQDVFERRVCPGRLCRFEASGLGVRAWFFFGRDASSQQKAQEHKRGSSKALRIR